MKDAKSVTERAALAGIDPRPMGRPKKQPPADAAQRIQDLAADGWSIVGIAQRMSADKKTLHRWFDEHPELREAFDQGRERERQALHNKLFRTAMEEESKGGVIAAIFLLKARHGYREGEAEGAGNRINVTFNLPGAQSREDFMKTVVSNESGE